MARFELDLALRLGLELLNVATNAAPRRWIVLAAALTCLPLALLAWRTVGDQAPIDDLDGRVTDSQRANERLLEDVCGAVTVETLGLVGVADARGRPEVDPIYSSCLWRQGDTEMAVRLSALPGLQTPVLEREVAGAVVVAGADRAVAYVEDEAEGRRAWIQHVEAEVDGVALQVEIIRPEAIPGAERAAIAIAEDVAAALG